MLDFDGTIARTIPAILHASEKMLAMHGYGIDPEQVERNFGLALPEAFRCFANDPNIDDATMEQMIVEFNTIYKNECEPLIELFDGVAETLGNVFNRWHKSCYLSYVVICSVLRLLFRKVIRTRKSL